MISKALPTLALVVALTAIFVTPIYGATSDLITTTCGDMYTDGELNSLDLLFLVKYLYKDGSEPLPLAPADCNGDGKINSLDLLYLVNYLFKGGPFPECSEAIHTEYASDCLWLDSAERSADRNLVSAYSSGCLAAEELLADSAEYMYARLDGNDLTVYHINAHYQCCLDYSVEFTVDGSAITARERDLGEQCYCLCYFNLESYLNDLDLTGITGFVVTLIGIDGDTVGVAHVEVGASDGYMHAEAEGNDIHIYHNGAYYQCCLEYSVEYQIDGYNITAIEHDTAESACHCLCYFNLESVLHGLTAGEYIVTLLAPEDYNDEKDTIGVDTVVIGETVSLISYITGACSWESFEKTISTAASASVVSYSLLGDTLTMTDTTSVVNCGAKFVVQFEQAGDTLRFFERNISYLQADCLCTFPITAKVVGIQPGLFTVELYRQVCPTCSTELVDRRTIFLSGW